jgi:hypothetical protein
MDEGHLPPFEWYEPGRAAGYVWVLDKVNKYPPKVACLVVRGNSRISPVNLTYRTPIKIQHKS